MSALLLGTGSKLLLGPSSALLLGPASEQPPPPIDQGAGFVILKRPSAIERHNDLALRLLLLVR
jgi:hypothetical protein